MPSDMRDRLKQLVWEAHLSWMRDDSDDREQMDVLLDSIPPGSFKNEKGEWVRLEKAGHEHLDAGVFSFHSEATRPSCERAPAFYMATAVHTEVDHAE